MRLLSVIAGAVTALSAVVMAQGAGASAAAAVMAEMPRCGLECMAMEIPKSNCTATDLPCICTNQQLTDMITLCVAQSCTIRDALTTQNTTATLCGAPVRDRTASVSIPGVVGLVIAFIFYSLRMISRLPRFGGRPGWDDAVMTLAMALAIGLGAISVPLANHGLGKDMWTVSFDDISTVLYLYYIDEDLYLAILPLTKISILLFYLRIFPKKSFRIAAYVVIALNIGYLIAFLLVSLFQCTPINAAWLRWDGEHPATCTNINAQGWTSAVFNLCLDILTMALPLPELSQLSMSFNKKIQTMIMFCVGIFVSIVSVVRLHSLVEFANTTNITWDYVEVGYWSTTEADVGIICACLPAVRGLLGRLFPKTMASTIRSTTKTPINSHTLSAASAAAKQLSNNGYDRNQYTNLEDGDSMPLVQVPSVSHGGERSGTPGTQETHVGNTV